jgi:hypothetical protein
MATPGTSRLSFLSRGRGCLRRLSSRVIDQVRKFAHAEPFEHFAIELSSGTMLFVHTRDHIALSDLGAGRVAILADDGTFDVISGLHITRVRKLTLEERIQ